MKKYFLQLNSKEELEEIISKAVANALEESTKQNEKDKYEILTTKDLCTWLKLSRVTLWQLKKQGIIPYLRLGNQLRYSKSEIINSLTKNNLKNQTK